MSRSTHPKGPTAEAARRHPPRHLRTGPAPSSSPERSSYPRKAALHVVTSAPISHSCRSSMRPPVVSCLPSTSASAKAPADPRPIWHLQVPDGRSCGPAKVIVAVHGVPSLRRQRGRSTAHAVPAGRAVHRGSVRLRRRALRAITQHVERIDTDHNCTPIDVTSTRECATASTMALASLFDTWNAQGINPLIACRQILAAHQVRAVTSMPPFHHSTH